MRSLHRLLYQGPISISLYFLVYLEFYLNAQFEAGNAKKRKDVKDISAFWVYLEGFTQLEVVGAGGGLRLRLRLQFWSIPWGMLVKRTTQRPKRNFIGFYGNDATQHCAYLVQLRRRKPCPTSLPVQAQLPRTTSSRRSTPQKAPWWCYSCVPPLPLLSLPFLCYPSPNSFHFSRPPSRPSGLQLECSCWSEVSSPPRIQHLPRRLQPQLLLQLQLEVIFAPSTSFTTPFSLACRHWHWYSGLSRNCSRSWSWCWCWCWGR